MLLPDRMEASRFDGTAFPRELVPVAAPMDVAYGVAESVTVTGGDKPRTADQRQAANELSLNVQNLQKRAAGVLPVRLDVPRAGQSHTFVRPLVMDEETRVSFRYNSNIRAREVELPDTTLAGTTLRGVQRILAAGLIAVFVGLSALHVFWAAGGRPAAPRRSHATLVGRSSHRRRSRRWPSLAPSVAAALVTAAAGRLARARNANASRPAPRVRARTRLRDARGRRFPLCRLLQVARRRSVPRLGHLAVLAAVSADRARGADPGQRARALNVDHSSRSAADGSMRPVRRAGM
jgi:hypothetical protein